MKRYFDFESDATIVMKKPGLLSLLKNQHPLMFIWFAFMSISMGFVYLLLFTTL